jgi:hypothetical protein
MATDSGYNNQKKKGTAQFETVQSLGSSKYGKSVASMSLYDKGAEAAIVSVVEILGRDGQVEFWEIEFTAHTAIVGDVFKTGGFEFEIVQIVNANKFRILPVSETIPAAAQLAKVKGWVTSKSTSDGDIAITFDSAPALYEYNGVDQVVTQDTTNPSNNRALPAAAFIIKDGVQVPVRKDTVTPANTVGMPVELVAASGTPINITAGDLNISTSSTNDSMAIGDVAGNKVEVIVNTTGSQSLSVIDEDNIFQTTAINTKLNEVKTKQDTGNVSLNSIDSKTPTVGQKLMAASTPIVIASDQSAIPVTGSFSIPGVSTEAKQDTGNSSLSSIDGKFTTLNAKDFATSAKQDTGNSSLSSIDGKFTTLNAKDFSTSAKQDTGNTSLSSIDGKLQNNGLLDSANSTATPLGANAVFTGTWTDITNYNSIALGVRTDQNSANDGLVAQYSTDGITVHHTHLYNIVANQGIGFNLVGEFKYFRISYTNGAIAQTSFVLQSILKTNPLFPSQYRLTNPLTDQTQATVSRSLIFGKTTGGGGGYIDVKVNPSGALAVEAAVTGSVSVSNFPATQPISAASLPLPSGASTLGEQQTQSTRIGDLTETAPATDTASSGLNGRLQRIAQRLTSLIALFPSSIGQKASSDSLSVVLASDSAPVITSGTITQIQATVGLTAVRATVSGSAPSATRKKLMIKPSKNNTGSIYFGSSAVTTASGMEIIGPDRLEFDLASFDFYLISDTAGQVVEIVEIN